MESDDLEAQEALAHDFIPASISVLITELVADVELL
jgi:hypothetical protein